MVTPSQKLKDLNIQLPRTQSPLGAYVPAVQVGRLIWVSGQLPLQDGLLTYRGKLGRDLNLEEGQKAAELCFINALSAVAQLGLSVDAIERVVKLTGYVQSAPEFYDQPGVINGASLLCHKIFGDKGLHARAALGAASLPKNAAVELEAIFHIGSPA